eukprot:8814075-Alexandrium_andersonii.AAC.1
MPSMPIPLLSAPLPPPATPVGTQVPPPPPVKGSRVRSDSEETVPIDRHMAGMAQQQQPQQESSQQPAQQAPVGVRDLGTRNDEETIPPGARGNTSVVAPGISVNPVPR